MKEFEFESQFHGDMVPHIIFGDEEKPFCQVRLRTGLCNVHFDEHRKSDCIRALLALNTERETIFVELLSVAERMNEKIANPGCSYTPKLKSLAARWQATTGGDATGETVEEGQV